MMDEEAGGDKEEIEEASVLQVIRAVEETRGYAFLIGAGTSKPEPDGIPTAGELIERWQEECYDYIEPDEGINEWINAREAEDDHDDVYGFWFEERHPTSGERRERIQDLVEDAKPAPAHIILAALMSGDNDRSYVPHVLTPNFDDLLFDAFYLYLEDKPLQIDHRAVAPEFKLTRDRPAIIKLHGDYLYNNLQNTKSETESLEPSMKDALERTVSEYGLIVVGYSGTDESIMHPLVDSDLSEYGIYWCARDPDNLSGQTEELLRKSDAYMVPIKGFENLMTQFGDRISDIELPTSRELIERAQDRADTLDQLIKQRKEFTTDEQERKYLKKTSMYSKGTEALQEENFQRAIEIYDDIIDQDPQYINAYTSRGVAKYNLGQYEAAIDDYTQAIDLNPESQIAYNNRGNAKRELEAYQEAIDDFSRAIDLNPEYSGAYHNRAGALYEIGEYKAAIHDLYQALELEPESVYARLNLAELRILTGDYEKAREDARMIQTTSNPLNVIAESLLLDLIAMVALGDDTDEKERRYRNICERDFTTHWDFSKIELWLENSDITTQQRTNIKQLLNLLRNHNKSAQDRTNDCMR